MGIKENLERDLLIALKQKDDVRKQTIRMILSSLKLLQVEKGQPVQDPDVLNVLQKELKIRQEAIDDAIKANRQDLVDANLMEINVIKAYLPEQLSMDEIKSLASQVINEVGALGMNDMGKVMKAILPKIQGRASNAMVNQAIREILSQG